MDDSYIQIDGEIRGGKPRIAGTRMTVSDIVLMHRRLGRALEEIAATYDLSMSAVYAAMAYYYDHQLEIDQSLDDEDDFAEAFKQNNPSRLRAKLEAMSVA